MSGINTSQADSLAKIDSNSIVKYRLPVQVSRFGITSQEIKVVLFLEL